MLPMCKCCQYQMPILNWKLELGIGDILTMATFNKVKIPLYDYN